MLENQRIPKDIVKNFKIDGVHALEENHTIAINYGLRRQLRLYDPADEKNTL